MGPICFADNFCPPPGPFVCAIGKFVVRIRYWPIRIFAVGIGLDLDRIEYVAPRVFAFGVFPFAVQPRETGLVGFHPRLLPPRIHPLHARF